MNGDENRCAREKCGHSVEDHDRDGIGECLVEWCDCSEFVRPED